MNWISLPTKATPCMRRCFDTERERLMAKGMNSADAFNAAYEWMLQAAPVAPQPDQQLLIELTAERNLLRAQLEKLLAELDRERFNSRDLLNRLQSRNERR